MRSALVFAAVLASAAPAEAWRWKKTPAPPTPVPAPVPTPDGTCDASYGYNSGSKCFDNYGVNDVWGWTTHVTRDTTLMLVHDSNGCDAGRGKKVGHVVIDYGRSTTVKFVEARGVDFTWVKVYVGRTPLPKVNNRYTCRPKTFAIQSRTKRTFTVTNKGRPFWIIVYAEACTLRTPAPFTPLPPTPVPVTPCPPTPAPATPAPHTPAPATPAPHTPAPHTPVPVVPSTPVPCVAAEQTTARVWIEAGGESTEVSGGAVGVPMLGWTVEDLTVRLDTFPDVMKLPRVRAHFPEQNAALAAGAEMKVTCPENCGGLGCEVIVVTYHCAPCSSQSNGMLPSLMAAAGWDAGSCAPRFQHRGGKRHQMVAFRKLVPAGETEETPATAQPLSNFAVFVRTGVVDCEELGEAQCAANGASCRWADGECRSTWCPKPKPGLPPVCEPCAGTGL